MVQTLLESSSLSGHTAPVKLVAVSPDGLYVATADTDRRVKVWRSGEVLMEKDFTGREGLWNPNRVRSVAFSADSRRLYVGAGPAVSGFEILTGERVWFRRRKPTFGFINTRPQSISVSRTGDIAIAFDDSTVEVWGENRAAWRDNDAPWLLTYFRDGQRLIGTDFVSVCVWDAATGTKLAKYKPPRWKAYALAASPVADVVGIRSLSEIELWEIETGLCLMSLAARPGMPTICFNPVREEFVAGDARGFSVYSFQGTDIVRVDVQGYSPISFAYSSNGAILYAGCSDGQIRTWELAG